MGFLRHLNRRFFKFFYVRVYEIDEGGKSTLVTCLKVKGIENTIMMYICTCVSLFAFENRSITYKEQRMGEVFHSLDTYARDDRDVGMCVVRIGRIVVSACDDLSIEPRV